MGASCDVHSGQRTTCPNRRTSRQRTLNVEVDLSCAHCAADGCIFAKNQEQISIHSYRNVFSLYTCFCVHLVVPTGGTRGAAIGLIAGDVIGQIRGEQICFNSTGLLHIAFTCPSTHRHSHAACEAPDSTTNSEKLRILDDVFMFYLPLSTRLWS